MEYFKQKNEDGFIVLLLILIISSVALLIGYNAVVLGLGELNMGFQVNDSAKSLSIAEGCVEEAMRQLDFNSSYSSGSLSFDDGSCTITVTNDDSNKLITVVGQSGTAYKTLEVNVTITTTPVTINSWEEKS